MKSLFEFSDILHSPIEAFYLSDEILKNPVEAHWHYFVEIIYLLRGEITVTCNEGTYTLVPGQMIFIPPQAIHSIYSVSGKPYLFSCMKFNIGKINLTGNYLPNLSYFFKNNTLWKDLPVVFDQTDFDSIKLEDFFIGCIKECHERQYGYDSYIYSCLSGMLIKILRLWYNEGHLSGFEYAKDNDEQNIHDILIYIDEHSHEKINVADLAAQCNMSYSYFAKVFHKHYGQSCKQYIEFIRLSKAENLLLFTDHDLTYIANETGFADCSHLIRAFKNYYDVTPKQFRLRYTKN